MSCSMLMIAHAPWDEDVLAIEFAKPTIAPNPEAICIEVVAVVVLYWDSDEVCTSVWVSVSVLFETNSHDKESLLSSYSLAHDVHNPSLQDSQSLMFHSITKI